LQCANNLKQIALGCHHFENAKGTLPLLYSSSNELGWMTQILSFCEQDNLYQQYNLARPWFDLSNANVVKQRIGILECPASPVERIYTAAYSGFDAMDGAPLGTSVTFTVASTDYFAIAGASSTTTVKAPSTIPAGYFHAYPQAPSTTDLAGAFGPQSATAAVHRFAEVTDGLSNTIMIGEMSGRPWLYLAGGQQVSAGFPSYVSTGSEDAAQNIPLAYGWGGWAHNNNFNVGTWSSDGTMQGGEAAINCSNYRGVYSFHPAGANGAFADGSVHLLAREMSPAVFFALATARAGEPVPEGANAY
jgi:hypothetical protein